MKSSDIKLATVLTYAGTLPLIACLVSYLWPITGIDRMLVAHAYGAVIISFLCGIHWAAFLFFPEKCPRYYLVSSNVVALLSWASLLIVDQGIARFLQPLCFLFLFALDARLRDQAIIPGWFYILRRNATAIVVLCLLALAWL
jgi:hypothetical protein